MLYFRQCRRAGHDARRRRKQTQVSAGDYLAILLLLDKSLLNDFGRWAEYVTSHFMSHDAYCRNSCCHRVDKIR